MSVRLEDLLASFRRHPRSAGEAPRTIELYSQSVRYVSRWLAVHDRPETLDELMRYSVSAELSASDQDAAREERQSDRRHQPGGQQWRCACETTQCVR
jgi:hypothetical protein